MTGLPMRGWLTLAALTLPRLAEACPACTSGQRDAPSPLYLILVVLPFVVGALAARAILRVLRD